MTAIAAYFKSAKASWIWLVLRLYVGYEWLTAGWEKVTGATPFDASGYLKGAVAKATGAHPAVQPWWASFLKGVAIPNVGLFNILVSWGEVLVGVALILGLATVFAIYMGMIMNFAYLLSGSGSTNPQLLILQLIILGLGGAYAGFVGVDYWFRPWFRSILKLDGAGAATRSVA
ncbi:MAG TPA: DoxX family protein [Symbiobacteriaceae bacterium]